MIKYKESLKKVSENDYIFNCIGFISDVQVTESQINYKANTRTVTISSWHTTKEYQHQGLGIKNLKQNFDNILSIFGTPEEIEYIWNGVNEYVLNWLKINFDAQNTEDIAVKKYDSSDNWESHIYELDIEKFLKYFKNIEN